MADINFSQQELKTLNFWKKERVFEKSIEQRKKAPEFIFYEGPPTANAKPGIHHVLSRVYKDIICRYKTMRGFRVKRRAGWDTHGLPVELEIEKKLGLKNKKDIEKYGIARFNQQCRRSVWKYKKDWERLTERIGFWLDTNDPYITYSANYIETVWWIIKKIWQKGFLYKDYKVVPYCPRCGTSLSSHEVAQGYKNIKENSIYVKFRVRSKDPDWKNTSILAWTTTPWTLPGNAALAINPQAQYVCIPDYREPGHWLVLGLDNLKGLLPKGSFSEKYNELFSLGIRAKEGKVDIFSGLEMVGVEYEPLFRFMKPNAPANRVIGVNFVSGTDGTGVVHIAPAFGEEDMEAGKKNDLPVLMTVDEGGRFRPEVKPWAGIFVKDADPLITEDLKKRGLIFKEELYEHEYPFCWRCSSPLLYYAKQSWFIKTSAVKSQLIKNNRRINWIPAHLRYGRFGEWLKEVKDWALSRERYWGTPFPVWECSGCSKKEVIGSKKDLADHKFTSNRYFLMRHGHSWRQVTNRISSFPEKFRCPLTSEGKKNIKKTARRLKKEKIDIIYASDLLRTKQTAQILGKELNISVRYDKRLRELDGGIFNGRHMSAFQKWGKWADPASRFSKRVPGGENYTDVKKRMYNFLLDTNRKYKDKTILIISHELPLTSLEAATRGLSDEEFLDWRGRRRLGVGEYRSLPFAVWPYNNSGYLDLHRPYIDKVVFKCSDCGGTMRRVSDVIDVWFDSGAMPFGQAHWPFAWPQIQNSKFKIQNYTKNGFQFPADYICEAVDQTRGWFYTLLAISTFLGLGSPYKNAISLGHVLDEKGDKMSKSKGNVVDPDYIIKKYGADSVRWYFYTANHPGDPKLFNEKDIEAVLKRFILTFWNSYLFWETYVKSSKFKVPISDKIMAGWEKAPIKNVLDKWIMSRLNRLVKDVTNRMDSYDVTGAARAISSFVIDDLSLWYIRRSRRRIQGLEGEKKFKDAALVLGIVLIQTSKLCAPFIPFLSETIYRRIGHRKANASVHLDLWPKSLNKTINNKLEKDMELVRAIVTKALAERSKAKVRVRQPLSRLTITNHNLRGKKELLDLISDEVNVKLIAFGRRFALNTNITSELREEGKVREIIRYVQQLRKQAGLQPRHRIEVYCQEPESVVRAIERNWSVIARETGAKSFVLSKHGKGAGRAMGQLRLDGVLCSLGVRKA